LYFGSDNDVEKEFAKLLEDRFKLELQGHSHWFLSTRLYREKDGSYILDQENYTKHVLQRYCDEGCAWGTPSFQSTPAPIEYTYSKSNRPNDDEKEIIEKRFNGLSMASAVSSLLYLALNTRSDILWVVNKLAKSSSNPGIKDFEALLHCFGYLRKYPDYAIKFYSNIEESPVYKVCKSNGIPVTDILAFTDSSWQDCPDTGRSTCGYKIFIQGGLVEAQSTLPVPVAMSSAEAEYMGACNSGTMIVHLRQLLYEFKYLGTPEYEIDGMFGKTPSIILTDNQATVKMSKNYKVTAKNRHVGRRWHFVRRGTKANLFDLKWIKGDDQLADDMTKSQAARVSKKHFDRTLIKVPDRVKGYRSDVVGNR
jgi:hypothetical protein